MIDVENLDCEGCPAEKQNLRDQEKIERNESLRLSEIESIGQIRLILLCESPPNKRFIYDRDSDYSTTGLRPSLRRELVGDGSDEHLFDYLRRKSIIVVDCALCPIHGLENKKDRRSAATVCLERHTHEYLDRYPDAPIITILPIKCGFRKRELPAIKKRVREHFEFSDLDGLEAAINSLAD